MLTYDSNYNIMCEHVFVHNKFTCCRKPTSSIAQKGWFFLFIHTRKPEDFWQSINE